MTLHNQYKTRPNGPVKYISNKGMNTMLRDMLYLTASLDTQDPRNKFIAKKCIQKTSKKVSVANTVYKLSKLKYNLKTSNIGSSNKIA